MAASQKTTSTNLAKTKIGFIGADKIVDLLIKGLINHSKIPAAQIYVAATSTTNTDQLKKDFQGVNTTTETIELFDKYNCDIVFVAVPGTAIQECESSGKGLTASYLQHSRGHKSVVCSLVNGVKLNQIKATLLDPKHLNESKIEFHRVVINAASAYGCGLCAVDVDPNSTQLSPLLKDLLASLSTQLVHIPEAQMDDACITMCSGVVFSYYMLWALSDGASKFEMSDEGAVKLVTQTMTSACQAQAVSGKSYEELLGEACSPEGAAGQGLEALREADLDATVSRAVWAARKRSAQISGEAKLEEADDQSAGEEEVSGKAKLEEARDESAGKA